MSQILILNAATTGFRDAITLGQGLPREKDGHPVRHYWKEALPLGKYLDKEQRPFEITPQRIDKLILSFNKGKAKGFYPPVLSRHPQRGEAKDAKMTLGRIVDAKKNDRGALELLHEMIGEDAILATARNRTSICTVGDVTDESGEHFEELIDHQALVPDPQLNNLEDFQPVLAASRAAAAETVVLQLAADEQEPTMLDLSKLREAIGAAKEIPDADVVAQCVAKLGEGKTATETLQLSRTKIDSFDAIKHRAETAESERDAAKAKVLELSKGNPDPVTLEDRRITAEERLAGLCEAGQCTDAMAKIIRENFLGDSSTPSLMLSRGARSGPVGAVFQILELNKALKGFQQTDAQVVGRHVPGGGEEQKTITIERLNELRTNAGLPPVKAA